METFPYTIIYSKNRHGYAKVQPDGSVLFSIPSKLKNNTDFFDDLYKRAHKLTQKHDTKQHITRRDLEWIYIFGEKVLREDITQIKASSSTKTIESFLKKELYDYSIQRLNTFSQIINTNYKSLTIRKAKSKRGSCTFDQKIMLNMNLIFLPSSHIQYVIAHETAHLIKKHHKADFRALVEKLYPKYKNIRKELKKVIIS